MPDEPLASAKYGITIQASHELHSAAEAAGEALRGLPAALDRALNATPEQRAEWARLHELREAEAAKRRAQARREAPSIPLAVEALLARMGWTRQYAEHLVQPYCTCGDDIDGWSYCEHARDLGLSA